MNAYIPTGGEAIEAILAEQARSNNTWQQPAAFNLAEQEDQQKLEALINSGAVQSVHDSLEQIASDLFSMNHPGKKDDVEFKAEYVQDIIEQGVSFGQWFYFPWSAKLVRYPEKDDHRALRTLRNRNLITGDEQARLYEATVAVFGLSVGSNVVEKMLLSGTGGKLILADMDVIEPSNLNRINGSLTDVGISKVDFMARKISEADPYIEQVHLREGVTVENLESLAISHRPDILVDEVDDLRIKAAIRLFGQKEKIPVLMATDLGDKSVVDVERHDQGIVEPFNGKLKEADIETLMTGELTAKKRGKYMLKIIGIKELTARLLESAAEIDNTLPGLPQLGVTASMGGSLVAIAARELLLGRKIDSGRYVCSPKKIMELSSPSSMRDTARAVLHFVRTRKS